MTRRPGFRAALIDTAVVVNAAGGAEALAQLFTAHLGESLGVAFGVYDLASRSVGLPAAEQEGAGWQAGLVLPPEPEQFPDCLRRRAVGVRPLPAGRPGGCAALTARGRGQLEEVTDAR